MYPLDSVALMYKKDGKGNIEMTHLSIRMEIQLFSCLYVSYQSMEDWRGARDIVRCNPCFHQQPRYDCLLVNFTDPGLHIARSRWKPRNRWASCQIREEAKESLFLSVEHVIRGALLMPVSAARDESTHILVDTVDADITEVGLNNAFSLPAPSVRKNAPASGARLVLAITIGVQRSGSPQERASLRRDGVNKICVRQAVAFSAVTRHEAMHTRIFFERGIARSANSNPTFHATSPASQKPVKENTNLTTTKPISACWTVAVRARFRRGELDAALKINGRDEPSPKPIKVTNFRRINRSNKVTKKGTTQP
ncbi:hypothetical protein B0H13DRAFT_1896861 [Mycena leptocephala]|nr:hypothetical protein B0H13DRAFT_1896861 [Mycena leptocephala]